MGLGFRSLEERSFVAWHNWRVWILGLAWVLGRNPSGCLWFGNGFRYGSLLVIRLSLAVAMGIYLSGCLWLGGYGNFVEIFGFVVCQWCSGGGCWFVGCCGSVVVAGAVCVCVCVCVFFFFFSILLCFSGSGGGGGGWLLVVGLSFSERWLLALGFGSEERRKRAKK